MKTRRLPCNAEQVLAIERGATRFTRAVKLREFGLCTDEGWDWEYRDRRGLHFITNYNLLALCPFGGPGDRLWIACPHWRGGGSTNDQVWDEFTRTTRWQDGREILDHGLQLDEHGKHYMLKRRSPATMPRWASRRIVEVTDVRVCRWDDITDEDARANGALPLKYGGYKSEFRAGLGAQICPGKDWVWNLADIDWVWNVTTRRIDA